MNRGIAMMEHKTLVILEGLKYERILIVKLMKESISTFLKADGLIVNLVSAGKSISLSYSLSHTSELHTLYIR